MKESRRVNANEKENCENIKSSLRRDGLQKEENHNRWDFKMKGSHDVQMVGKKR